MASNISSVVVLGPSGRRHAIKVSPNTSILQVLEEACRKHSVNPNDYELKHYNKSIDLSLSVRFANLPNNAMLELHPTKAVRQESIVTVGLQLESGDRLTGNFTPSTTVWDVVTNCLNTSSEDTTSQPSCIYMRQMISGDEMKKITLRSLGLTSGKAVFRIIYRQPFELQQQAHVSAPLKKKVTEQAVVESIERSINLGDPCCSVRKQACLDFSSAGEKHIDSESKPNHHGSQYDTSENVMCSKSDVGNSFSVKFQDTLPTYANITSIEKELNQSMVCDPNRQTNLDDMMEVDNSTESSENLPVEEKGTVKILGERNAILFNLEDITTLPRTEVPDDFFDLTIQDVRYLMEEYKKVRIELENKPLELTLEKENKILQRLSLYTQCVIRIYFPDRLVLQGIFSVEETVHSVMEFIRTFLEDKELNFYLYTAPPKVKLAMEMTLLECRLLPAAVVHFGCNKNLNSYLLSHIKDQVSDPGAAFKAAAESRRNKSFSPIHTTNEDLDKGTDVSLQPTTSNFELSGTKVPKWLQFNKK